MALTVLGHFYFFKQYSLVSSHIHKKNWATCSYTSEHYWILLRSVCQFYYFKVEAFTFSVFLHDILKFFLKYQIWKESFNYIDAFFRKLVPFSGASLCIRDNFFIQIVENLYYQPEPVIFRYTQSRLPIVGPWLTMLFNKANSYFRQRFNRVKTVEQHD